MKKRRNMTIDKFWKIIESSRSKLQKNIAEGLRDKQADNLRKIIKNFSYEEILSFARIFKTLQIKAYKTKLWFIAKIIGEGCSDDSFLDFTSWLISMGREVYEEALLNPDSVAKVSLQSNVEDIFFEDYQYIAHKVYEEIAGEQMPSSNFKYPEIPIGEKVVENIDSIKQLYPNLYKYYLKESI
jgi:hypothetical protein